eukprot:gene9155-16280_t
MPSANANDMSVAVQLVRRFRPEQHADDDAVPGEDKGKKKKEGDSDAVEADDDAVSGEDKGKKKKKKEGGSETK